MYWKIELKKTTIAFGLQYEKQEKAKFFLFKWYYNKKTEKIGTLDTTHNLVLGIQYANQRIRMLTHQHQTIKERIA